MKHYIMTIISTLAFFPPTETHNVIANRMKKTPNPRILASLFIVYEVDVYTVLTRHNKNIIQGSYICQVLISTSLSLPCPWHTRTSY